MAVSKRTRYEVLKRDNHTCRYCGATAPNATLTVDHVMPVALGGTDEPSNLVAACRDCNAGKSSTNPTDAMVADVKAIDLQWANAMKRAAAILAGQRRKRDAYAKAFADAWEAHGRSLDGCDPYAVDRIYEAGLPKAEMVEVVGIACSQRGVYDRFNYFMGICWKRVTAIQEAARELLAAEGGDA